MLHSEFLNAFNQGCVRGASSIVSASSFGLVTVAIPLPRFWASFISQMRDRPRVDCARSSQ